LTHALRIVYYRRIVTGEGLWVPARRIGGEFTCWVIFVRAEARFVLR
jgi:hypothetical protein